MCGEEEDGDMVLYLRLAGNIMFPIEFHHKDGYIMMNRNFCIADTCTYIKKD